MSNKSISTILALTTLLSSIAIAPQCAQANQIPQIQEQIQLSFAPVVEKISPAVVNIYTTRKVKVQTFNPFANDPFFSQFFGRNMFGAPMRERMENSLGSGVILDPNGTIITNAHVIKGAQEITVALSDGREFKAELRLQDDASDLAVLKLTNPPKNLPSAALKPSENIKVGDLVLAIGNPFGVGQTVTSGIISAQGRSSLNINDYNFFIQTDAAINPGNSGGALVTLDGGVIGINSAIYSRDGGSLGIGFAIPSEMVSTIIAAEAAGQTGTEGITRPWLGMTSQNLSSDIAQSLNLSKPTGVLVGKLHPLSPLKKAGINQGDVIIEFNGKEIRNAAELKFRTTTVAMNNAYELTTIKNGKTRTHSIKAIAPPNKPAPNETLIDGNHPLSGASIANINPALAVKMDLQAEEGIVITQIRRGSPASRFMRTGTIIKFINGHEIKTIKDIQKHIKNTGQGWKMVIQNGTQTQQLLLR